MTFHLIPIKQYAKNEFTWATWGDWLGYWNSSIRKNKKFRPFKEAREFVRSLGIKKLERMARVLCKSGNKPDDIPSASPMESQYQGMEKEMKKFRDFESAREFASSLGSKKSRKEWKEYCKSGKIA